MGSNHPVKVDVGLITATNRDLQATVAAGTFACLETCKVTTSCEQTTVNGRPRVLSNLGKAHGQRALALRPHRPLDDKSAYRELAAVRAKPDPLRLMTLAPFISVLTDVLGDGASSCLSSY